MNELFLNFLRTSVVVGVLTVALALLAPLWNKTFTAAWKRRLWCLLTLVLLFGTFLRLPDGVPQVEVALPQRQVLVADTGVKLIAPEATMEERYGADVTAWPEEYFSPRYNPLLSSVFPADVLPLPERRVDVLSVLEIAWLIGAAVFLLWQGIGGALFSRRVRRWGRTAESPALQELYASLCAESPRSAPALWICSGVGSPQLRGLVHSKILLPREDYTAVEAAYILRHELTHWRCRDLTWKALTLLANALHWFNPAAWLLRREANRDMERACDERVCAGATAEARRAYGEVLLASLHKERQAGLSTYFYGGKTIMKERLLNILSTKNRRRGAVLTVLCAGLTILAISLVACTQPAAPARAPQAEDYVRAIYMPLGEEAHIPTTIWKTDTAPADTMGKILTSYDLSDSEKVVCYWDLEQVYKYWALRRGDTLTRFAQEYNAYETGYGVQVYSNVLGHTGFYIISPRGAAYTAYDYYYLDENGMPTLLADCANYVVEQDLNGDGEKELLWVYHGREAYYYFRRNNAYRADDTVYMADVNAILKEARPDWQIESVQPDPMAGNLLPFRYQTAPDGALLDGAIGFGMESMVFYEKADPNRARPDAAITAMAQAHIQEAIAQTEQQFEIGDDLSGKNFYSDTHVQVLDSRQTSLEQVFCLPAEDGSGQVELWSLAYQLQLNHPDKISLAGGATMLNGWLIIGPDGDGYIQPLLVVWRDAKGACTLLETQTEGTVGEDYYGNYAFYAAELLYAQTGHRAETLNFNVFTDPDFTETPYHLEESPGQWSLYVPENWVRLPNVENPPDPAASTRVCVGLWHDPADSNVALMLYHLDGRSGDPKLSLNLLHAAAADRGAGEINFVSEGYGNMNTASGYVQQHTAVTTQNVVFSAFAVNDGKGGAWGVITSCPKDKRSSKGSYTELSTGTFLALYPARESLLAYSATHYDPGSSDVFFADLTADGREELVVRTIFDEAGKLLPKVTAATDTRWSGTVEVLSEAADGSIVTLYEFSCGSAHALWGELYCTTVNGQDCLLEYHPASSTGSSAFSYALFRLTGAGQRTILKENSLEFPSQPEARREAGISDKTVEAFLAEVDGYLANARPIMAYDKILDPLTGEEGDLRLATPGNFVWGFPRE